LCGFWLIALVFSLRFTVLGFGINRILLTFGGFRAILCIFACLW